MSLASDVLVLTAAASGALGDTVFSHNQHSPYIRPRTIPYDPGTSYQLASRQALIDARARWDTLTAEQRHGWHVYTANVPLPDRLGLLRHLDAPVHYVRSLLPRILLGLTLSDDAPTDFALPSFVTPLAVPHSFGTKKRISITIADEPWRHQDGAALYIAVGLTVPSTVNFYATPFRIQHVVYGSSTAPSPLTFQFSATDQHDVDTRVPIYFRLTLPDNRLSTIHRVLVDTD